MLVLLLTDMPEGLEERARCVAPDAHVIRADAAEARRSGKLSEAEIIVGTLPRGDFERVTHLRWLQIDSAGAGGYEALPESILLTNASGTQGIPIAEHVFAMLLALTRALLDAQRHAREKRWKEGQASRRIELHGSTIAVLGLGDIGSHVAKLAKGFDMTVLAVKRTPGEKPEHVDALFDDDGIDEALPRADVVVMTLPGTDETDRILDGRRIGLMKRGAIFINVGRGCTVEEPALIEALRSGRLSGAGLDVFEKEPLPTESPLWSMENVIVTPHVAGISPKLSARLADIFLDNLGRYVKGEELRNLVDRKLGY